MPMPPAAFSPLTTTKSARSSVAQLAEHGADAAPAGGADDIADEQDRGQGGDARAPSLGGRILGAWQERPEHIGAGGVEIRRPTPAPGDPAAPQPGATPVAVDPVVVPRWIQAVVLPLAIVGAFLLIKAAGPVALIFIVAALVALLLNPFVVMLQRARFPRGVAVRACT